MTTVYSKLNNPFGGDSQTFMIKNTDVDLIDKIKVAINKLRNVNQKPRKTRAAKFPCSVCDKNCNINQEAIFCPHCDHCHVMLNPNRNIQYDQMGQMMPPFNVCSVL